MHTVLGNLGQFKDIRDEHLLRSGWCFCHRSHGKYTFKAKLVMLFIRAWRAHAPPWRWDEKEREIATLGIFWINLIVSSFGMRHVTQIYSL